MHLNTKRLCKSILDFGLTQPCRTFNTVWSHPKEINYTFCSVFPLLVLLHAKELPLTIVYYLPIIFFFLFFFFKYFYCISSDFSDLPDMTDEHIDLSVYALTDWLLYILHLTYIQK